MRALDSFASPQDSEEGVETGQEVFEGRALDCGGGRLSRDMTFDERSSLAGV